METALISLMLITVIMFGVLTVAQSYLSAQDTIMTAWRTMEGRMSDRSRTEFVTINTQTASAGAIMEVTFRNEGETKLADFDQWDVIFQYYTASGTYSITWLPYATTLSTGKWTVAGIYTDAALATPEIYEPGIFNPGEEMIVQLEVSPPMGVGTTALATVAAVNGISASAIITR